MRRSLFAFGVAYESRGDKIYVSVSISATNLEDGIEQSVKSTLRTMRNLVYKRRSKRIPGMTTESVAET